MFYEIDPKAQDNRYFAKDTLYSSVDWTQLDQVVDAFRQRIKDWYLDPANELAKNGHFAFSVMALNCLLIEAMSQYTYDKSGKQTFKDFVKLKLHSDYSSTLPSQIQHKDNSGHEYTLENVADVLYHGFRCGILHQAHVTPYGLVDPDLTQPPIRHDSGCLKYTATGADCPVVIANPIKMLSDVEAAFTSYISDLKDRDPKNDGLRDNFKSRFTNSFGIDVKSAS